MALRAVVVDDEALGRRGIVSRLSKSDAVDVVAECRNGREAIEAVRELRPDLIFLDVQMPGLDGFDVVRELNPEERPHVIFVTAYDRHALRAFQVHALDYLLKPIDDERFDEALRRARSAVDQKREVELGRRLLAALGSARIRREATGERSVPDCLLVRDRGRVIFVRVADVDWIEAEADYVRLHAGPRAWLLRRTMASLERRLPPESFLRIHRSTIVNAERVAEMRPLENGDCLLRLRDGTELRASRTHREALSRLTGR